MTNEQQKQLSAAFQTSVPVALDALKDLNLSFDQKWEVERAFHQAAIKTLIALMEAGVDIDADKFLNGIWCDVDQVYNADSDFNS